VGTDVGDVGHFPEGIYGIDDVSVPGEFKTSKSVINALKIVLRSRKLNSITSDKGREFKNKEVRSFPKKEDIHTFPFILYGLRNSWFHYKIGNISDFAGIVLVHLCRRILT
jgi:hypothetical protein